MIIPVPLLQGLCGVSDKILDKLPPFYVTIVCSYAYVNDLYYKSEPRMELLHNLWCGSLFPYIDQDWVAAGFYTVADLPVKGGKIDVIVVKQCLESVGCRRSLYLKCCAFQSEHASYLSSSVVGTFVPNTELFFVNKGIGSDRDYKCVSLDNWCQVLECLPFKVPECEHIFKRMLLNCKISKFHEINYKILARILATPKIIAKVRGQENIAWCGHLGTLEHILLHCKETKNLRYLVCSKIFKCTLSDR